MKTLLCAATEIEAKACRKGVAHNADFEVLKTGMGLELSAKKLLQRLEHSPKPDRIISTGFAGSRVPNAQVGTWIQASSISMQGKDLLPLPLLWTEISTIDFLSVSELTQQISNHAVDMESYSLAQIARDWNIPFHILRVISDTPEEPIPSHFSHFVVGATTPNPLRKISAYLRGLNGVLTRPRLTAQYIAKSRPLPAILTSGWRHLSHPM